MFLAHLFKAGYYLFKAGYHAVLALWHSLAAGVLRLRAAQSRGVARWYALVSATAARVGSPRRQTLILGAAYLAFYGALLFIARSVMESVVDAYRVSRADSAVDWLLVGGAFVVPALVGLRVSFRYWWRGAVNAGAPLVFPALVVGTAIAVLTMAFAGLSVLSSSEHTPTPGYETYEHYYAWHLADAVPLLAIPDTLNWNLGFDPDSTGIGVLLLTYKLMVIIPLVGFARALNETRRQASQPIVVEVFHAEGSELIDIVSDFQQHAFEEVAERATDSAEFLARLSGKARVVAEARPELRWFEAVLIRKTDGEAGGQSGADGLTVFEAASGIRVGDLKSDDVVSYGRVFRTLGVRGLTGLSCPAFITAVVGERGYSATLCLSSSDVVIEQVRREIPI